MNGGQTDDSFWEEELAWISCYFNQTKTSMAPINFLREAMPKQKDKQLKIKGL